MVLNSFMRGIQACIDRVFADFEVDPARVFAYHAELIAVLKAKDSDRAGHLVATYIDTTGRAMLQHVSRTNPQLLTAPIGDS